ncbi:MAG: hypothetical protein REH83_01490 [Rickettsiella sp.]|nr:hypothetical protein [Rickettsiella sp.]
MHEKNLEKIGHFNHFFQAGLFSSIFIFTSNIAGIRTILENSLRAILFPIAIAPDAIASLLALLSFTNAKNKNFGKTFDLIYVPIKAALVFTAVFAGISLLTVHSLFLAAVGSGMAYHISLYLYNTYRWLRTPKNSLSSLKLRDLYKKNIIKNGISSLIGSIVLGGILATMVFAPYLAASILTVAGIGTAVMLLVSSTYALYNHRKQSVSTTETAAQIETTNDDSNSSRNQSQNHTTISKDYYHRKFRKEQLTGDLNTDKDFLLKEISNKKRELYSEVEQSQRKISELFWPQNPKRYIKCDYLNKLEYQIRRVYNEKHNLSPDNDFQTDPLNVFKFPPKKAFQSFFRAVGDVEDIAEASKNYVEKHKRSVCDYFIQRK